jgi:hypothetical protein
MARPASSRPAQPQPDDDLSEAARAVVHDAGDPRIDAHLAAMGLGPDPVPTSTRRTQGGADAAELASLRDRVASLERELATTITRSNVLATLLALAILVIVVLVALLVVSRPAG